VSLRTRILLAFAAIVLIPIALLAFGVRQEMTRRLSNEYQARVDTVVEVIREDLTLEGDGISARLASLKAALQNDTQFRLAITGFEPAQAYLSNYARTAMGLTGLSLLQIQDGDGRILSSGPERDLLVVARTDSFSIGDQTYMLTGGIVVDEPFLARLARDREVKVGLKADPTKADPPDDAAVGRDLQVPLLRTRPGAPHEMVQARLRVTQPLTPLRRLVRSADSWFLATAAGTSVTALLLAVWVSSRISRPLADLAEKTAVLDLDRLDIQFAEGTDEVGRLSGLLGELTDRLRRSTARLRVAEHRATTGYLARQVNHDIKNGLIPIRNVIRHLSQVQQDDPAALPAVYAERRQTVDSSLAYLEELATSYARLSPPVTRRPCDLNVLVAEVAFSARSYGRNDVVTQLAANLPRVVGDPIAFVRILENLVTNAVDSLESKAGRVTISTESIQRDGEPAIRLTVADTGCGMTAEETGRIFNDFYTTKEGGTGLGLSIVRRLVMDLHGTVAVESEPGKGTRITIDFPTDDFART